jgi:hypothetical protein
MSEAQGFYSVSFASEYTNDLAPENGIFIGAQLTIHDLAFTVQDIKRVRCEFSEGELPFAGAQGRESTSFDLSGNNGTFACIEHAEDGTRLFVGSYEEFDALDFINLRPLDGWSDPTRKSI